MAIPEEAAADEVGVETKPLSDDDVAVVAEATSEALSTSDNNEFEALAVAADAELAEDEVIEEPLAFVEDIAVLIEEAELNAPASALVTVLWEEEIPEDIELVALLMVLNAVPLAGVEALVVVPLAKETALSEMVGSCEDSDDSAECGIGIVGVAREEELSGGVGAGEELPVAAARVA